MATAQLEAWGSTQRAALDEASEATAFAIADLAVARMMLHRRRAVAGEVVAGFFSALGARFGPYLGGRVPHAPADPAPEIAGGRQAGTIVEALCGPAAPLLLERAGLAQMEGRDAEARTDLDRLLAAFPGFVPAALSAARLDLAAGEPERGIRRLLPLERELCDLREGAGLLADTLHSLGLHQVGSRYDLLAVTCSGDHDHRGNLCAPVDVAGRIVASDRMPRGTAVEVTEDGRTLFNDRGIYYVAHSELSDEPIARLIDQVGGARRRGRSFRLEARDVGARARDRLETVAARLRVFAWSQAPDRTRSRLAEFRWVWSRMWTRAVHLLRGSIRSAIRATYSTYKRLPDVCRAQIYRVMWSRSWRRLVETAARSAEATRPRFELLGREQTADIMRRRLRAGIMRVFGLPPEVFTAEQVDPWPFTARDSVPPARPLPPAGEKLLQELLAEATGAQTTKAQA